ncbi:MAG: lactonase family protein [Melioribacteraceae bacterium]|nr:lactonase family protein [Melioribacteraceae bacterium]
MKSTILLFKYLTVLLMVITYSCSDEESSEMYFFVGTYTDGDSQGIYQYKINTKSGELHFVNATGDVVNPSYLALNADNKFIYAVNEVDNFDTSGSGSITAFSINNETKKLEKLNTISSRGAHPCYISVDQTNRFVCTANYSGGNLSVIPILTDGSLSHDSFVVMHRGSGINEMRQGGPHVHFVDFDVDGQYMYAVDLGIDRIVTYKLDYIGGNVEPTEYPFTELKPGAGPRHLSFTPDNKFAYVINELDNTIVSFKVDRSTGSLQQLATYNTLPDGFEGTSYCADIHVHPSGKYLYGSNRGHNSIVIFKIDESSGALRLIGHEPAKGDWPRNFAIDPTGKFLLVANQKSDNIFVFRINQETGALEYTSHSAEVPSPVCIRFMR